MSEIYWLTRIGVIGSACQVFAIWGIIIAICGVMFIPMWLEDWCDDEKDKKRVWTAVKTFFILWIISILGVIFVPTQKELIAIYGIGTTIDYIKSNDKAKELPDKAVEAMTKYLESITDDKDKD